MHTAQRKLVIFGECISYTRQHRIDIEHHMKIDRILS